MSRSVKITDTTRQTRTTISNVPTNCTFAQFKSIANEQGTNLNGQRVKVADTFSNGRQDWVLIDSDVLPNDDGLTLYSVEARTKAGK
jgi:hypothetical protein